MTRGFFWRCLAFALVAGGVAAAQDAPLRVLIFSGLNNHDWRSTTPVLVDMFKGCPRFGTVDVTETLGQCDETTFARYDVIVSNWTPYPKTAREWPDATEKAFLAFVRRGGGFVLFHAAACTFQGWPEFQQIIGLTWEEKKTNHAHYHNFRVSVRDAHHPIAKGLRDFYITDELYQNMVTRTDRPFHTVWDAFSAKAVGGTEKVEPMLITLPYGKGRGVNCMLGHDAAAMRNVAFRTLMLRSAEWAATGRVTIPVPEEWPGSYAGGIVSGVDIEAAIAAAKGYRRNEDRGPLATVENLAAAAASRRDGTVLASCLAKAIQGDATPDAKAFFCRELGVAGTEQEVPVLAAQLEDEVIEASARRALEQIPGSAADTALLAALERVSPRFIPGVINSLGERRVRSAVAALVARIEDPDAQIASSAVAALGKIGDSACVRALRDALGKATEARRAEIAEACLACAGIAGGREAKALCMAVEQAPLDAPHHAAAWLARVERSGASGVEEAARALTSEDNMMREAALRYLSEANGASATRALTRVLKNAEPGMAVSILGVLGERGDTRAARDVLALAAHSDPAVRLGALKALERVGTCDVVAVLLARAAETKDAEQEAARMSLERLNAEGTDTALARALVRSRPAIQIAALDVLAKRKAAAKTDVVLNATSNGESKVREAAWRALKTLASERYLARMLAHLERTAGDDECNAAQDAIAGVAKGMDAADQERILLARWDGTYTPVARSLMRVMASLGNDWALAKVREIYAQTPVKALRGLSVEALSSWPSPAALEDLFAIARSDSDETNKAVAVRGIAPMMGLMVDGDAALIVGRLKEALGLTHDDKDKRALLGELGKRPCAAALDLALEYLKEPGVANEAGLAAIQAAAALDATQSIRIKAAMRDVMAAVPSRDIDKQACEMLRKAGWPVNLAIGGVASSPDKIDSDGGASGDQAAIDGNPDTYWDEADNQASYVFDVTFKEPISVAGLRIKGHAYHSYCPKDFVIVCDGVPVKTIRDAEYDQTANEFATGFPAVTCKTVELQITGYYGNSPAIRELELYASNPETAMTENTMPNPPEYGWQQGADAFALMNHGRVVWQWNYGKELPKSYFSPVTLGGGMELTWLSPSDHWWHRALWFSWKELNGVNYWEEDKERHCKGINDIVSVETTPNADHSARIGMTVAYHPPNEPPVLTEKRVIDVSAPDAQGGYAIDWRSDFRAGPQDVHMQGGTSGGGYAGMSVRIAPKSCDWRLVDSEGREDVPTESFAKTTHGQHARWMDFSLVDMASGETAGIAILDHPGNLRFPSQWHNLIDDKVPFGYFSPAPLWSEPYTLPAGQTMTLRYRIVIHPGRTDRPGLEKQWQEWAKEK